MLPEGFDILEEVPDLGCILEGQGSRIPFPGEVSAQYAVCVGLAMRSDDEHQALNAFEWLDRVTGPEWVQTYIADAMVRLRSKNRFGPFAAMDSADTLGLDMDSNVSEAIARCE